MNKPVVDGHYYSPINSENDIKYGLQFCQTERKSKVLPGINIDETTILNNIHILGNINQNSIVKFPENKNSEYRYALNNGMFSYVDGIILARWIEKLQPKCIIEIGSGHSSCVMMDTCEKLKLSTELIFIEPYAVNLKNLVGNSFIDKVTLHEKLVQDVDIAVFSKLTAGDILFIDCSHVSKAGSDVNHIIHRVLPLLNSGVYIHIHDIFWPFEYPTHWVSR